MFHPPSEKSLLFDRGFRPGNKFDGSILNRWSLTGYNQHPNIVLRRVTNTSCLPYVLNELVDRHELIFPIFACNQPKKNSLDLTFLPQVLVGTLSKRVTEFKCSSTESISAGARWWYEDELAAPDTRVPDTQGLWLLLILLITQTPLSCPHSERGTLCL